MNKKTTIIVSTITIISITGFGIFASQPKIVTGDTNVSQEQLTEVVSKQVVKDTTQDIKIAEIAQETAQTANEVKNTKKEVVEVKEVVTKLVEVPAPAPAPVVEPTPAPVVVEPVTTIDPIYSEEGCKTLRKALIAPLNSVSPKNDNFCGFSFYNYGIQIYFEKKEIHFYKNLVFVKIMTFQEAKEFVSSVKNPLIK